MRESSPTGLVCGWVLDLKERGLVWKEEGLETPLG